MRSRTSLGSLSHALGPREPTLRLHLARRVLSEDQWVAGTTVAEYLDDLRRSVRAPGARLALYADRGGNIAATFGPTSVPVAHQGPRALPWLLVVLSADRGMGLFTAASARPPPAADA